MAGADWLDVLVRNGADALRDADELAHAWTAPKDAPPAVNATIADEHLTDYGNARRLVASHGEDLRFCASRGGWLVWDDTRWVVDETGAIMRRAKAMVRQMYRAAEGINDTRDRQALAKHALASESAARLRAMVQVAESEPGIPITSDQLDCDPLLLNVENGTLDLRTGILRPHRREDLLTKIAATPYDPDAACPTWLAFLGDVMDGSTSLIGYLQRAIGYTLTALTTEQCFFFLFGTGANGKTTLLVTLQGLLGDYASQAAPELLLMTRGEVHPTGTADLVGRRFVVSTEIEQGRRLAEAFVKQITGGDRIKARRMRQDFFEFDSTHKVFVAANHKPHIRGTDNGIWRRIHLIPFNVAISNEKRDPLLGNRLRSEWPGILRWAVEGSLAWQRDGLRPSEEVCRATAGYRAEMDGIAAFIAACCVTHPRAMATAEQLYRAYTRWSGAGNELPMSQKAFGTALGEKGFDKKRKNNSSPTTWYGIGLRAEEDEA